MNITSAASLAASVLALSLAVGLGSKDLVSRSLEREAGRNTTPEEVGDPFRHL